MRRVLTMRKNRKKTVMKKSRSVLCKNFRIQSFIKSIDGIAVQAAKAVNHVSTNRNGSQQANVAGMTPIFKIV